MVITSLENEKVKELVKLGQKKYRDITGTYLIEGEHLVEEAYKSGDILQLIVLEGENCPYSVPVFEVTEDVMRKISSLDTPPKIMALCKKKNYSQIVGDRVLLLDGIQDPGNLGTIIRSSLAFDVSCIILSKECVDLYNPKVIRATQGMFFHLPILSMDLKEAIISLKEKHIPVYGTSVVDGVDVSSLDREKKKRYALVMGNEGSGISQEVFDLCDMNLNIKMNSEVESLNVGVACGILLYEFDR